MAAGAGARMKPVRRQTGLWKTFSPGSHLITGNFEKELDPKSMFTGLLPRPEVALLAGRTD